MNTDKKHISIIGFGWGCISFLKYIDYNKYDITVFTKDPNFHFTPLLSNQVINNYSITQNIEKYEIKNKTTEVHNVDFQTNEIIVSGNDKYPFQYLLFSHGGEINTFGISGVPEHCYFLKRTEDALKIRNDLQRKLDVQEKVFINIVGCGLTGSEIVGNLLDLKNSKLHITAIDGLPRPLNIFPTEIGEYTRQFWKENGVQTYFNYFLKDINSNELTIQKNNDIHKLKYDISIWCGGIKSNLLSQTINNNLGIKCSFGIPVNKFLEVNENKNIFAIGDCSVFPYRIPLSAQVAYQQGKYLAERFNQDFKNNNEFKFNDKGKIGYIGKGESVFSTEIFGQQLTFKGKICGIFNKIIHVYNGIDYRQKEDIFSNIFL